MISVLRPGLRLHKAGGKQCCGCTGDSGAEGLVRMIEQSEAPKEAAERMEDMEHVGGNVQDMEHAKGLDHTEEFKGIIEAVLFTMGESVPLEKLANVLELEKEETKNIIRQMMSEYEEQNRGIQIIELEGAYQMCTKKQMYEYLIKIARQPKKQVLTDVLLETLSIIAYKQPVTRIEIEKIRGVSSGHAVNKLVEYNLVCEVGRLDVPGRPLLFGTTEEFLRSFGVNSIDELPQPQPEQVEEFRHEAEEEMQIRMKV